MILHASLANKALLKSWISLKPSTPIAFAHVKRSHDTQQIFLLPSEPPHQNLVNTDCILLQRLIGIWKQLIMYLGIAVRTAFSRVNFSALLRKHVDQLIDLWRIWSTIEVNRSLFLLPKCSGRPRYLPRPHTLLLYWFLSFFLLQTWPPVGLLKKKVMKDLILLSSGLSHFYTLRGFVLIFHNLYGLLDRRTWCHLRRADDSPLDKPSQLLYPGVFHHSHPFDIS